MGKYAGDNNSFRHRFSVPTEDTIVEEWIAKQCNLSSSIRVLIRNFVREYGNRDSTCVEFGVPARRAGRPSKHDSLRFLVSSDDGLPVYREDDEDVVQAAGSAKTEKQSESRQKKTGKEKSSVPKSAAPPVDMMTIDYGDSEDGEDDGDFIRGDVSPSMDQESADTLASLFGQRPDTGL